VGFRFRKSVSILPGLRVNFSTGGTSLSLGRRGFHYTLGPKGTRVTVGIPGTGLSWTQYTPHGSSSPGHAQRKEHREARVEPQRLATDPPLVPIESASAEKVSALSTSELALLLKSAHSRIRLSPLVLFLCCVLLIISFRSNYGIIIQLSIIYSAIAIPFSIFLDRYRRSVKIEYELDKVSSVIASALAESFADLKACRSIWSIRAEAYTSDWKRHAGATRLNKRQRIYLQSKKPACIRGRVAFPAINLGADELYFLPDAALLVTKHSVAALHYHDFSISASPTRFIEEETVPDDARVVGETWRFVNKSGGPDRRFNFNKRLPICLYGEMDFQSPGGLNARIQFSNYSAGDRFFKVFETLNRSEPYTESKSITHFKEPSRWPTTVLCSLFLSLGTILASLAISDKLSNLQSLAQTEDRIESARLYQAEVTTAKSGQQSFEQLPPKTASALPRMTSVSDSTSAARPVTSLTRTTIPLPRPRPRR
jgi:hypothetical protein